MKLKVVEAMKRYGGSFVVSLADCIMKADSDNFKRICDAFPEYIEKYSKMASDIKQFGKLE
ncbi:MAG TPA: hypothetical protein VMV56_07520 [Williamwhitmania sp.]|nr:hypothetical protein [Williamwhitmania sp.]